jgi:outer membrane protein TolC
MKRSLLALFPLVLAAEVHSLSLEEAVRAAFNQNPDVLLARLDQQKSLQTVAIARDPFFPKVFTGSGLAWTEGFPATIEGSAPSIIQAKGVMSIFNRSQSYLVAQARENTRAAEQDVRLRQDDVAYRVAVLYTDALQAARQVEIAAQQLASQERARAAIAQRVAEGRELELELRKAQLAVLKSRQRAETLAMERDRAETDLALLLGYPAGDRVRASGEPPRLELPASEDDAVRSALESSRELRKLESSIAAKGLEARSYRAQKLPRVDLVAQYGLFSRFNNLQDYFNRFQRNNTQIGASIVLPLIPSRAADAFANQADLDVRKLQVQVNSTRGRIEAETRKGWQDVRRAELARDVARADLDVAREQLSVNLAQYEEGRLPLAQLEQARVAENEKWLAYYDAQHVLERARLYVLKQSGTLLAALQ